jgi:hypothetical protein
MAHTLEVVFALERFEFAADDRLEVVGRWEGLSGKRMGRATLTVLEEGGRRRRLHALPGGREPGDQPWRASFAWDGNGTTVEGAELELGRRLVVELPPPRRRRRRTAEKQQHTPPPIGERRIEELELRLGEAQAELVELRRRLEDEEAARRSLEGQLTATHDRLAVHDEEADALDAERAETERLRRVNDEEHSELTSLRDEIERLRGELGDRHAPGARAATAAHRRVVPSHRARARTGAELWAARIASAALAGMLLLALLLIIASVA